MYRLHYAPDNASIIVRFVLEEIGAPYEIALVDRSVRAQDGPAYRKVNPAGMIPALEMPDGVMFETAAILLRLSEHHGRMAPHIGSKERGAFLTWMLFMSNSVQTLMRLNFYPEKYVGTGGAEQRCLQAQLQATGSADMTLPRAFEILNGFVSERHWGGEVTVLDYYIAACVRWAALYPCGQCGWFDLARYPALRDLVLGLETRPAALKVAALEGLGDTIFSAPTYPNPPEGTAH